jgi:hypothetical protein
MLYIHGTYWSFPILCSGNNKLDSKMDKIKKTSFKYDLEIQSALFDFIGTIDNIYDALDLEFTNDEAIKIEEIQGKRDGK